jgi:hypothetical protein
MADHLRTELVLDAVGMARFTRKPARTSGLLASLGRVGSVFDNAMAESFFATLKAELVYRRAWPTRHELEMEVFSYLEGFTDTRRRHSRLDNLSPAADEQFLTEQMTTERGVRLTEVTSRALERTPSSLCPMARVSNSASVSRGGRPGRARGVR